MYDGRDPNKESKRPAISPENKKKFMDAIVEMVAEEAVGNVERFSEPMSPRIVCFSAIVILRAVREMTRSTKFLCEVIQEALLKTEVIK